MGEEGEIGGWVRGGSYLERELVALHEDADGVRHKLVGHLQDLVREGGRHEHHLAGDGRSRREPEVRQECSNIDAIIQNATKDQMHIVQVASHSRFQCTQLGRLVLS